MNKQELKLLDSLKELKETCGVIGIKAEFEAEGARMDELIWLRELVVRADLGFVIKIGGCEAVHDMNQSKLLGATGIMAPMIETPFAMSKFSSAANRVYGEDIETVEWIINAETKTCHANYKAILEKGKGFLNTVTVGGIMNSADFDVTLFKQGEVYFAKMLPKKKEVKQVYASIEVYFNPTLTMVESIKMIEKSGEYTTVKLLSPKVNTTINESVFKVN